MQDQAFPDVLRRDAFNLVSALDAYVAVSARLVESWLDMDVYADCSSKIDAIREHAAAVPSLTVLRLQLVIAHSELVGTLWQHSSVGVAEARMQQVQERHTMAIEALRTAAARLLQAE